MRFYLLIFVYLLILPFNALSDSHRELSSDQERLYKFKIGNLALHNPQITFHEKTIGGKLNLTYMLFVSGDELINLINAKVELYYKDQLFPFSEKTFYRTMLPNDMSISWFDKPFQGNLNLTKLDSALSIDASSILYTLTDKTNSIDINVNFVLNKINNMHGPPQYSPFMSHGANLYYFTNNLDFGHSYEFDSIIDFGPNAILDGKVASIKDVRKIAFYEHGAEVLDENTEIDQPWAILQSCLINDQAYYLFYTIKDAFKYEQGIEVDQYPNFHHPQRRSGYFNGKLPFKLNKEFQACTFQWGELKNTFEKDPSGLNRYHKLGSPIDGLENLVYENGLDSILVTTPSFICGNKSAFEELKIIMKAGHQGEDEFMLRYNLKNKSMLHDPSIHEEILRLLKVDYPVYIQVYGGPENKELCGMNIQIAPKGFGGIPNEYEAMLNKSPKLAEAFMDNIVGH